MPFPPLAVPIPRNIRLQKRIRRLDQQIQSVIEARKRSPLQGDILHVLIENNDRQQVIDEVMTFILAGHHTTASALSFALYLLIQYPEAHQRLLQEVQGVLADQPLSQDTIHQLSYGRNVIMETLRLYPISFGLARKCVEDDVINGHKIPKGTTILMAPYFTHRHPDFWPDPERFDPDRFSEERGGAKHKLAYFPFGAGPRQCIGNYFAMVEAVIILARICQRYDICATSSQQPKIKYHVALGLGDFPVQFKKRGVPDMCC